MTNIKKQSILFLVTDKDGKTYYSGPIDGIWRPECQNAYERFMQDFLTEEVEESPAVTKDDRDENDLNAV